jgi:hypothetical protein
MHMYEEDKMVGEKRREEILAWLKAEQRSLTGTELAQRANVSRQVIVQDIALLRAAKAPIIATPRGYCYQREQEQETKHQRVIACRHQYADTENELNIMVDNGVTVIDVIVEHPIYGELKGALMLETRKDVQNFIRKLEETDANLLSALTSGVHLHTVSARSEQQLDEACADLEAAGYLLKL